MDPLGPNWVRHGEQGWHWGQGGWGGLSGLCGQKGLGGQFWYVDILNKLKILTICQVQFVHELQMFLKDLK